MKSPIPRARPGLRALAAASLLAASMACVGPSSRFDSFAIGLGLRTEIVPGDGFEHAVYELVRPAGPRLHVYLDGDGTPWLRGTVAASDPTPDDYLVLRLMAQDWRPSVYLGRPCYHGVAAPSQCSDYYYTYGRYSPEVVASMVAALRGVAAQRGATELVFIGHSGGGVLAMLLAAHFPSTLAVVTVAANLDVDQWVAHHGYDPLRGSLNPALEQPLPASIVQLHFAGGRDRVVPPALARPVAERSPDAVFRVVPEFDHACCWQVIWADVLREVELQVADRPSG